MQRRKEILCEWRSTQEPQNSSFVGGIPLLPTAMDLPCCKLCGRIQSFFLEVAIPHGHPLHGYSIAVFSCTSCAIPGHFIPTMLDGPRSGVDIPIEFLTHYQDNFLIAVFPTETARARLDYKPRIRYARLELGDEPLGAPSFGRLGGSPEWVLDDESPATCCGRPMYFLLQVHSEFEFHIYDAAPRQVELSLDGEEVTSGKTHYKLFLGNELYLFGAKECQEIPIYAITQVD